MSQKRFEVVYDQGKLENIKVIVDTETGVQYLFLSNGMSGGLTVLMDENGKPAVAKK